MFLARQITRDNSDSPPAFPRPILMSFLMDSVVVVKIFPPNTTPYAASDWNKLGAAPIRASP